MEGFELGQWPPTAIQENYKSSLFLLFLCHDSVLFHLPLGNCLTPKKVGPCKGAFPRWHYNGASSKCEQFVFGGCKANNNNYLSEEECLNACKNIKGNAQLIVLWQCCTIGLQEYLYMKTVLIYLCLKAVCCFLSPMETLKRNLKNLHLVIYFTMTVNRPINCHTILKASSKSILLFNSSKKINEMVFNFLVTLDLCVLCTCIIK